jgi:clan AA aspartic protease
MILGVVNADLEARIQVEVQGPGGQLQAVEAVIDTGFNGSFTLPPGLIASLGLSWLCQQQGILADGNVQIFDVYTATLLWNGQLRQVETEAVDAQPLVGMSLLEGHELQMSVMSGGSVTINALPTP